MMKATIKLFRGLVVMRWKPVITFSGSAWDKNKNKKQKKKKSLTFTLILICRKNGCSVLVICLYRQRSESLSLWVEWFWRSGFPDFICQVHVRFGGGKQEDLRFEVTDLQEVYWLQAFKIREWGHKTWGCIYLTTCQCYIQWCIICKTAKIIIIVYDINRA